MIEMRSIDGKLTPDMGKKLRWTLHRKDVEPDQARGGVESLLHIVNSYDLCDVVVDAVSLDEGALPVAQPHRFAGIPFFTDEIVPRGEIWMIQKGEIVAKITGLAPVQL